ncbi:hypothetical protein HK102_013051, partial [Quaeritorhiza haematococci]
MAPNATAPADLVKKDDEGLFNQGPQLAEFEVRHYQEEAHSRPPEPVRKGRGTLEISPTETHEQYNTIIRTSNSPAQRQKMAFLERNLENNSPTSRNNLFN